jgi:hypothetical protein
LPQFWQVDGAPTQVQPASMSQAPLQPSPADVSPSSQSSNRDWIVLLPQTSLRWQPAVQPLPLSAVLRPALPRAA